jgi:sporulation protein YlmC with PRC-barrel domain
VRDGEDHPTPAVARLSTIVGGSVERIDGARLGRLTDLVVDGHAHRPSVRTLVVTTSAHSHTSVRSSERLLVPMSEVVAVDPLVVRGTDVVARAGDVVELAVGELLLARDVLDTQVYDIGGRRIARVGDVDLDVRPGWIEVLGVDTGFGSVCHRLGLHRLGRRLGDRVVAWPDIHLTSRRGHAVQLEAPRAAVQRMTDEQLADLLERVTTTHGADILASLAPARAAATLATTGHEVAPRLVGAMPDVDADAVLHELPAPHARRLREALRERARRPRRRFRRHQPRRSARGAPRRRGRR